MVLAGSIRDDGPLPEVITDALAAQRAMRERIRGVGFCLMVATMLHSIAVGNLLPAWVRVACVDINPATVTKLTDRGSIQTVGVVTDAETTVRLREASLKLVEAQRMPSVAFNSIYARNAYPSGVVPAFDRTNWTMGVSVNVPILTGGRQKGDQAVALAELEQARAQRRQIEELAALDTRSSWAELVAARAAFEATAGTVQQAQRAYQIANVRFTNGVSTQLELSDARLSLQQAEANRTVAARDLQVARARVALLPTLPVSSPSGSGVVPLRVPQPQSPTVPAPSQPQAGGQIRNASTQGAQPQVGLQ